MYQFATPYQHAKTLQMTNSLILICGNNISRILVTHGFCLLSILRTMMVKSHHINTKPSLERHEKLRLIFIIVYIRKARFADDGCDNLYKREISNNCFTYNIDTSCSRARKAVDRAFSPSDRSINCRLIIILEFT